MKIVSSLLALALLATVPAFAEEVSEEVVNQVVPDVAPAHEEPKPEEIPADGDAAEEVTPEQA